MGEFYGRSFKCTTSTYVLDATTKPSVTVTDKIGPALGKIQKFLNDLNTDYISKTATSQVVSGTFSFTSPTSFLYTQLPSGASPTEVSNVQYVQNYVGAALSGISSSAPETLTTANGGATAGDTSLTVVSTSGYPSAGTLLVGSEAISYTGTTGTTFTGLTRGAYGTTAAIIANGATINNYLLLSRSTTTATPKMVVTGAGNVGIGTTTPSVNLEISASDSNTSLNLTNLNSTVARTPKISIVNYRGAVDTSGSSNISFKNFRGIPSARLGNLSGDILGSITASGYNQNYASELTGASINFEADANWLIPESPSRITFTTNNGLTTSERMRITKDGNVGIGTSAPTAKLHVVSDIDGTAKFENTGGAPGISLLKPGSVNLLSIGGAAAAGQWVTGSAINDVVFVANGGGNYIFSNSAGTSQLMKITSAGNVGIGTTAPGGALVIERNDNAASAAGPSINLKNTNPSDPAGAGYNVAWSNYVAGNGTVLGQFGANFGTGTAAPWNSGSGFYITTRTNHPIIFATGATTTEKLRITNAGNVGIGTTVPNAPLHTVVPFAKTDTGYRVVQRFTSNDAAASNPFGLDISITGAALLSNRSVTLNTSDMNLTNGGNIIMQPSAGNVGIGTSTPSAKLTVSSGGIQVNPASGQDSFVVTNAATNDTVIITDDGDITASSLHLDRSSGGDSVISSITSDIVFETANTERIRVLNSSGNVGIGTTTPSYLLHVNGTAGGTSAYQVTSDQRFKKNILPIARALAKLTYIDGVSYNFRNDEFPELNFSKRKEMGVIAQKVEVVFPEAVSKDKDGFRSVAYTMLIAPIIEAIKELKNWLLGIESEVKLHKREIANLKATNEKLLNDNLQLKNRLDEIERQLSKK